MTTIDKLRKAGVLGALGEAMKAEIATITGGGVLEGFYGGQLATLGAVSFGDDPLHTAQIKELLTIALLAAEHNKQNLAVHYVVADLLGVPRSQVDSALAVVGVYTGADNVTDALDVRAATDTFVEGFEVARGDSAAEITGKLLEGLRKAVS